MTMQDKSAEAVRQRAEMRFAKATERAREAEAALKDQKAMNDAEAAKVVRLRNLRLAKEAADREAPSPAVPTAKPSRRKAAAAAP